MNLIFKKHLVFIQVVHNNMTHIEDLAILGNMFNDMVESDYSKQNPSEYRLNQDQINKLHIICRTTQNSHYGYGLYTNEIYQDPNNHVDYQLSLF